MGLKAVSARRAAAVVVNGDGQKVVLDIGMRNPWTAADESPRLEVVGGADAGSEK